jgi:sterol 14-demethylase
MLFELAANPDLVKRIREEQSVIRASPGARPSEYAELDLDTLKQCVLLDQTLKETLRMHPPIHTVMRLVERDMKTEEGLTIPKGNFLCSGITVGHYNETKFPDPYRFYPERHALDTGDAGEWTIGGVDIAQKSAKNFYLPFGAGLLPVS